MQRVLPAVLLLLTLGALPLEISSRLLMCALLAVMSRRHWALGRCPPVNRLLQPSLQWQHNTDCRVTMDDACHVAARHAYYAVWGECPQVNRGQLVWVSATVCQTTR